ncbi:MAG: hypothetical protein ACHQTF_11110 [Gemmatimonadales bacterium]|jgi:hypothetical protein
MIPLSHLWLPIIASAVAVFVVSALLHMLFTYHNTDYRRVPNEDEVRAVINKGGLTPGQYVLPYAMGPGAMKDPAIVQKMTEGPTGFLLLRRPSGPAMGPALGQWFVLTLVIAFLVGYVAALTIAPGADHMGVFRVVSAIAFLAYAGSQAQEAIWRAVPWAAVIKTIIDGLVFALVTGGLFAVMWPAQ